MTPEHASPSLTTRSSDVLIAVLLEEDGQEVVRYFAEGTDPTPAASAIQAALAAIGSCSDLDWDEWSAELDRIRHASPPTPPIEL